MARNTSSPLGCTSTSELVQRLKNPRNDPKEAGAINALIASMINTFTNNPTLRYMPEAVMLSSSGIKGDQYQDLITAFANTIIHGTTDGSILPQGVLQSFACVLRKAPDALSASDSNLGSVLASLCGRLNEARSRAELKAQYELVSLLSVVLNAMVDIKISGIGRETLHEPLLKQLKDLQGHIEPRLAQASSYSYQALLRVSDDEGPYEALFRRTGRLIQATANIAGAVPTMDPTKIIDATPDMLKLLSFFKSVVDGAQNIYESSQEINGIIEGMNDLSKRSWYTALRYSELLIRAEAFQMLEAFSQQPPYCELEDFWCGLYAQLEQAWASGTQSLRGKIVELITKIIPRERSKSQRVQEWVGIISRTLKQPGWKGAYPQKPRKFFPWKKDTYEPMLSMFNIQTMKPDDNLSDLLETAWYTCKEALIFDVDKAICKYYTEDSRLEIKRLSGDLLDMSQCYINLSIIEHSEGEKSTSGGREGEQQFSALSLFSRLKVGAANTDRNVTLPGIFDDQKLQNGGMVQPRRILIRGRAGVGKSTLCKKIVHDFIHAQLWSNLFDRILWIPLRNLKGKSNLDDLLHHEYLQHAPWKGRESLFSTLNDMIFDGSHKRTLLLLDGLDEISAAQTPSGVEMTESFRRLLNYQNVIITSRPHAASLSGLAHFDLELETVGFNQSQVKTYLEKVVKEKSVTEAIQAFINGHWLVQGLVQIPIQLDALCYSWDEEMQTRGVPETMTTLYEAIEWKLWAKDIVQLERKDKDGHVSEAQARTLRTRAQIKTRVAKEMEFLGFLAFTGIYNDIIEFNQYHRDRTYLEAGTPEINDVVLEKLSFLRTSSSSQKKTATCHFIHLTFQEYFAAQYFVQHWTSDQPLTCFNLSLINPNGVTRIRPKEFLRDKKYDSRYDILWRFVTGLLCSKGENELRGFFDTIEDEPRDLLGPTHLQIFMHYFSEVPPSNRGKYPQHMQTKVDSCCRQLSLFENELIQRVSLCQEMEYPDHILEQMLETEADNVKEAILIAIRRRPQLSPGLLEMIITFLRHDAPSSLRSPSIRTFIGRSLLPQRILEALTFQLQHDDPKVRKFSVSVLGRHYSLPESTLEILVSQREHDCDPSVRKYAIDALGRQFSLPERILEALLSQLGHSDPSVRKYAINAFGRQTFLPERVLEVLVSQLEHDDSTVRSSAIGALERQSSLPEKILEALVSKIEQHDSLSVKTSAIAALGRKPPLPGRVLEALVFQLEHNPDASVKKSAIAALDKQSSLPERILKALVIQLEHDSDPSVKVSAMNSLAGQHHLPRRILETLGAQIEHGDLFTKQYAIVALNGHYLPEKILQILGFQLEHCVNLWVREHVITALSSRSSLPQRTIEILGFQLEHGDLSAKESAICALHFQKSLPENILNALVFELEHGSLSMQKSAINVLGKQYFFPERIMEALVFQLEHGSISMKQSVNNALGRQYPLPERILEALQFQLEHDSDPSVKELAIVALSTQLPLSEGILEALVFQLDHTFAAVKESAMFVLDKQPYLPERILKILVSQLEHNCDPSINYKAGETLWKQTHFFSLLPRLNIHALRIIYRYMVKRSMSERCDCYMKDGTLYINSLHERREIHFLERKDEAMEAIRAEAAAMGSPILNWYWSNETDDTGSSVRQSYCMDSDCAQTSVRGKGLG